MRSQKVSHDCLTHTMGVEIYVYSEPWTHYIPGGYQYGFGEEYRTFQWQFVRSPKTRKQNFVYICLSKQTFHKDYRQNIAWCFIAKIICFKWEFFLELQVFPKWHKIGQMIKRLRIFFFFSYKETKVLLPLWEWNFREKFNWAKTREKILPFEWVFSDLSHPFFCQNFEKIW